MVRSGSIAMPSPYSSSASMKPRASESPSPAFTATMVSPSARCVWRCASSTGISLRQLVHQVAQKLMTTGRPRSSLRRKRTPSRFEAEKSRAKSPGRTPTDAPVDPGGVSTRRAGSAEPSGPPPGSSTKKSRANKPARSTAASTARATLTCTIARRPVGRGCSSAPPFAIGTSSATILALRASCRCAPDHHAASVCSPPPRSPSKINCTYFSA